MMVTSFFGHIIGDGWEQMEEPKIGIIINAGFHTMEQMPIFMVQIPIPVLSGQIHILQFSKQAYMQLRQRDFRKYEIKKGMSY